MPLIGPLWIIRDGAVAEAYHIGYISFGWPKVQSLRGIKKDPKAFKDAYLKAYPDQAMPLAGRRAAELMNGVCGGERGERRRRGVGGRGWGGEGGGDGEGG